MRADTGKELGETPLSMEIPYGDAAVEFVFKKEGFESKIVSVVPNLPAPLSATLQPVPPKAGAQARAPPPVAPPRPRRQRTRRPPKKKPHRPKLDDDAVLEPSFK